MLQCHVYQTMMPLVIAGYFDGFRLPVRSSQEDKGKRRKMARRETKKEDVNISSTMSACTCSTEAWVLDQGLVIPPYWIS